MDEITIQGATEEAKYCNVCPQHCIIGYLAYTNQTTNETGTTMVIFAPEECPLKNEKE